MIWYIDLNLPPNFDSEQNGDNDPCQYFYIRFVHSSIRFLCTFLIRLAYFQVSNQLNWYTIEYSIDLKITNLIMYCWRLVILYCKWDKAQFQKTSKWLTNTCAEWTKSSSVTRSLRLSVSFLSTFHCTFYSPMNEKENQISYYYKHSMKYSYYLPWQWPLGMHTDPDLHVPWVIPLPFKPPLMPHA